MTDKTISFRVPEGLEKHLLKHAEKKGCSVGAGVRHALDEYFAQKNDSDKLANIENKIGGIQQTNEFLFYKLEKIEAATKGIALGLDQVYGAKK